MGVQQTPSGPVTYQAPPPVTMAAHPAAAPVTYGSPAGPVTYGHAAAPVTLGAPVTAAGTMSAPVTVGHGPCGPVTYAAPHGMAMTPQYPGLPVTYQHPGLQMAPPGQ